MRRRWLASQVLGTAPGRGLLVAWAACGRQAGAPAYWPWVQVLRAVATARPDRHTIGRIARVHPELGAHLETSIRTGTQCSYQPSGPIGWQLKFPFDLVDIEYR
jgi:hypothetical protein